MRILLVHPDDSALYGPWAAQRWDLIVDLGKSSSNSAEAWHKQTRTPVVRCDSFRRGVGDLRLVKRFFEMGRGCLIDEEGIDWWDLTSLVIVPEAETLFVLQRLVGEIGDRVELWGTRDGWPANLVAILAKAKLFSFYGSGWARSGKRIAHYAKLFQRFGVSELKEIVLDKYDSNFRWRSRFAAERTPLTEPIVLVPSAYQNVSRMAAAYARSLPGQGFVVVTTRQNGLQFSHTTNVKTRPLAAYVGGDTDTSLLEIQDRWQALERKLRTDRAFDALAIAGVFERFPDWFRNCLVARNAWRRVFEREPVQAVFCGDDSNIYTRLPVLLAVRRKIPTVDFHHGAFDGRYLFKELTCDLYLAKNEMERDYLVRVCGLPEDRIAVGSPPAVELRRLEEPKPRPAKSVVLFSEPYENVGMRVEEVYGQLLPLLCRVARENQRNVIVKLHPFESVPQRRRIIEKLLTPADYTMVTVIGGALTKDLLAQAWFGITIESTTVIDCLQQGVCCFLCGWLSMSPFGYAQQYARFGVGEFLEEASQIAEIPRRLQEFNAKPPAPLNLSPTVDPVSLQQWLMPRAAREARSAS